LRRDSHRGASGFTADELAGACLVLTEDMEEALVLRENAGGDTLRTAVIEPPYPSHWR